MGIWTDLWRTEAKGWAFGHIGSVVAIKADKRYVSVMLRQLRIVNARVGFGRSLVRTAVIVMAVSALHHSRGLPPPQMVATLPCGGKFCQYAIGRSISGQLHHGEAYGCVAVSTLLSYHRTSP